MLNPLQGPPNGDATTPLERVAGDKVASLRAHERWASSPDALGCYWDELFNAVCARLDQRADHSAEPALQAGVRECVAALAQLHVSLDNQRARRGRRAADFAALQPPRGRP